MSTLSMPAMRARSWKLPVAFNTIALPFVLSLAMSGLMSGFLTWWNVGFVGLATQWLGAWGASWALAFPTVLLILPLARRIVAAVVEPVGSSR
jgi:uncharacterized protein DUF2798